MNITFLIKSFGKEHVILQKQLEYLYIFIDNLNKNYNEGCKIEKLCSEIHKDLLEEAIWIGNET